MFKMRKIFFCVLILSFILLPAYSMAGYLGFDKVKQAADKAGYDATTETTLAETIGVGIKAAISFVGVIFLVLTVYAGYLWLTARGEEEPIKKAQKIIIASVIGLIIVVSAYSITNLVVPRILEKTTGEGGGKAPVGGPMVECCSFCATWATTSCPPKEILSEEECETKKGNYEGLVPSEQCQ